MQESAGEQEGGRRVEGDGETNQVSDSVPLRPQTSAESTVVPAVFDNIDMEKKQTMVCHHNRVAITLCVT